MIDGKLLIEKLVTYSKTFLYASELDEIFLRNTLLVYFKLKEPMAKTPNLDYIKHMTVPDVLFNEIKDYSLENSIAEDDTQATLFAAFIMGQLTQKPSEINQSFKYIREKMGAQPACDYLYKLCVMNNYIQKSAIEKNLGWTYKDKNNILEITINLSKPEKDNKDIAKLVSERAKQKDKKYPPCALCEENEGYLGSYTHPPRANLRTVSVSIGGEDWKVQYSPYAYFDEHCIAFNEKHTPMVMGRETVSKLLDFIELFPNYFVGSNSDLPIIGGSILNHEHFQGGKHLMPMHKAPILYLLKSEKFHDVEVGILDWYNSAIRLTGYNRNTINELGGDIIEAWKTYSDEVVGIINSKEERHNSCTVMARYLDDKYCLEIILRNNSVNALYPDGVFHAHPEYHNIKKEGIGLIEAMGLFILPGRLKAQTEEISAILCKEKIFDPKDGDPMLVHKDMIAKLSSENPNLKDRKKADDIIRDYINKTCVGILDNTAVFKKDDAGFIGFKRFLLTCDIK